MTVHSPEEPKTLKAVSMNIKSIDSNTVSCFSFPEFPMMEVEKVILSYRGKISSIRGGITRQNKSDYLFNANQRACIGLNWQQEIRAHNLVRMHPGRLPLDVFRVPPIEKRPKDRSRTHWRDYISLQAWELIGILQEELESVAGERDVWVSLLDLLDPWPDLR